jgi:hypothetical protein
MNSSLYHRLKPAIRRIQFRRVAITMACIWFCAALVIGLMVLLNRSGSLDVGAIPVWVLPAAVAGISGIGFLIALFRPIKSAELAETIEGAFPDLDAGLITAMEQRSTDGQPLGFLQQDVLRRAVNHSYANKWESVVPGWHLFASPLAGLIGLLALVAAMLQLTFFPKPMPEDISISFADAIVDKTNYEISVEPGNAEVERGSSLLVLARFDEGIPPEANLCVTDAEGNETFLPMNKSLDDPVFGARILAIKNPVSYRVDFAGQATDDYDVTVFEYPKMTRADAKLAYPEYTELSEKVIQDVRRINAVEGTTATFSLFLNKPVSSATLIPIGDAEQAKNLNPIVDANDPKRLNIAIEMLESQKYQLKLVDTQERENRTPPKFVLNVSVNKPPSLKLLSPVRDLQASALEEILLSANVWDDFGVKQFGVSYGIAGKDEFDTVLAEDVAPKKRQKEDHLLELESLKAQPDDLVSYFFWAEDVGPDGERRKTASDMFFAEVRHFDEIFRQGQAQPNQQQQQQQQQQQSQNGQKAQELAELQKEIINATWKLVRREVANEPSPEFAEDVNLISQSQASAIEQLAELAEALEDPESRTHVEKASTYMNDAVRQLSGAASNGDVDELKPALSSEKAAYQGLLKLRAREHEVTMQQQQQQQQGQQGQQNNRQQQQLDQLNLKQDENRYENEKLAQDQQSQQEQTASEDRQVLSRLRELAQRQSDLNQRVKELQSSLEEAQTEEEREEIERRLKSLREQQEQLLRDTEELQDRMDQEGNQERMAEESEKLDDARQTQQRALEALEKGETSRAAAEGTRAERDLDELKEEFQDRTAGQFSEEMRELRNEAQELEEKENEIAKALENEKPQTGKKEKGSLRETEEGDQDREISQQLAEQQLAVEDLRQKMRETIEEAEVFEPLLAEDLYETYRDSETSRPDQALESARQSFQRGWLDDAKTEERRAQAGIQELREGIEKAAESILGDETEALRAAERTLRDLNQELQQEMGEGQPQGERREGENEQRDGGRAEDQQDNDQKNNEGREGRRQNRDGDSREQNEDGEKNEERQQEDDPKEGDQKERSGNRQGQRQSDQQDEPESQAERGEPQNGQGQPREGQESESQEGESQEGEPREGSQRQGQGEREGQQGQQGRGQEQEGEGQQSEGQQQGRGEASREDMNEEMRNFAPNQSGGENQNRGGANQQRNFGGPGNQRMMRPLTGDDFRDWSDRLRDVEEMVDDPDLRAEASRIREQAREIRKELRERHSAEPNWELIKLKVARPLAELQNRVAEELMRRTSKDALVPLDRDPVPVQYQDAVKKYYERLGKGE